MPLGRPAKNADEPSRSPRNDSLQHLPAHQFPATPQNSETAASTTDANADWANDPLFKETNLESEVFEQQRRQRVYRGRTAAMLHRYMRYALETGRIPSILGGEFFRSRVTSYSVTTFEDRAIFVHDMEKCLDRLDELSRQILARIVLQGHDHNQAARLFGCTQRNIRRNLMEALDRMADILLEVGLLERLPVAARLAENPDSDAPSSPVEKACQGGEATDFLLSDCEDGE
jgi:DNA-directed RNA polymerase specialized sigma24 family protein